MNIVAILGMTLVLGLTSVTIEPVQAQAATRKTGYTQTVTTVKKKAKASSKTLGTLKINKKVKYTTTKNGKWAKIKYKGKTAYVKKCYIKKKKVSSKKVYANGNGKFKSYMSYTCITLKGKEYTLTHSVATTGKYGIRQINGYYCVAIGTGYGMEVGDYGVVVLTNGTRIPIIMCDTKQNAHTDSTNKYGIGNNDVLEFIVNTSAMPALVRRMGSYAYACDSWSAGVKYVEIYDRNYFE